MFELNFAHQGIWEKEINNFIGFKSKIDRKKIKHVLSLNWEEHCLECVVPLCYKSCLIYKKRIDGNCLRFLYGIYPNKNFSGHYNFGADLRFRKWAKLETRVNLISIPLKVLKEKYSFLIQKIRVNIIYKIGVIAYFYYMIQKIFDQINQIYKKIKFSSSKGKLEKNIEDQFDEFVLECFSHENDSFNLILEQKIRSNNIEKLVLRISIEVKPKYNLYKFPINKFDLSYINYENTICLYPEHVGYRGRRLIFTWLDFIKYNDYNNTKKAPHAKMVKCIAWDLDNTIWDGILVNSDKNKLTLKSNVKYLIKALDKKGFLQTIVSKNNFEDAWDVIKKLKLKKYFIYPQINWREKSENLKKISKKININLDSFALIDDSSFERNEVETALPQVRIYSEKEIPKLIEYGEFNIPITKASKRRKLSYIANVERDKVLSSFSGSYEQFLKTCNMEMTIFIPKKESQILRCWELIQRSNQLNLSSNRYTKEEIYNLIANPKKLCLAFNCKDKFGDYGLVGFACIDESKENPIIQDFVISCRVALRKVEYTFFNWLALKEKNKNKRLLIANLKKTERNSPMFSVFKDLPFKTIKKEKKKVTMVFDLSKQIRLKKLIKINEELR